MRIEWIKKVYSDGKHNAFPGLAFYQGKYFLVFRNADGHISNSSDQITMISNNAKDWEILTRQNFNISEIQTIDYRDSYLLVYKDKLLLYSFCTPVTSGKREKSYTQVQTITQESKNWSSTHIIQHNCTLWSPYYWDDNFYGIAYSKKGERFQTDLFHSYDGFEWNIIGPVTPDGSETALYSFDKDSLTAFVRKETIPYHLEIFHSKKPFDSWIKISEIPKIIQCPRIFEMNGRRFLTGRDRPDYMQTANPHKPSFARHKTKIWEIMENAFLREVLELPSAGDNSYPEILMLQDNRFLICYYSQHEIDQSGIWKDAMSTDIFIASIKLCF